MKILTLSSVYPNPAQPTLGLFVRERMQRVADEGQEVTVVAPVPYFPADPLIRSVKRGYRPAVPGRLRPSNGAVLHPPFLCPPGVLKSLDGWLYALSLLPVLQRVHGRSPFQLIDAHFTYPDGVAASLLARRFGVPFTVTLRGTEVPHARERLKRVQMKRVFRRAAALMAVSGSLARLAVELGAPPQRVHVIPNGVDTGRFRPLPQEEARRGLDLPVQGPVLLTVGALVRRKGIHRVLDVLPRLCRRYPDLVYVVVGGGSVEGDMSRELHRMIGERNLGQHVRMEGPRPPDMLPAYYSAADLFVLPTTNEGWANVLVESLACGTPVVTTHVGGNREVVCRDALGIVLETLDREALEEAICSGLERSWDREAVAAHAASRDWSRVACEVIRVFQKVVAEHQTSEVGKGRTS
ncbi:Glycosyltransferase involved in cell wall bisynthesis [Desulfacinum hydrothermale DSM 13146]|uniref:Glycosyltransferase involved in cell wall bisynthesis n=1 Tax=Desulfacinum hydrothermale DSM 13146 TaxID=1121390 RepID=A0A1W1XQN6_9BACT|nr:glycosyltransferase [Desulfacinum hydrothermale]SMC26300.1 Glycosyltransferase involved in cell wall bisynthesis [Desulfacinum hydrothermale DSM 13146]